MVRESGRTAGPAPPPAWAPPPPPPPPEHRRRLAELSPPPPKKDRQPRGGSTIGRRRRRPTALFWHVPRSGGAGGEKRRDAREITGVRGVASGLGPNGPTVGTTRDRGHTIDRDATKLSGSSRKRPSRDRTRHTGRYYPPPPARPGIDARSETPWGGSGSGVPGVWPRRHFFVSYPRTRAVTYAVGRRAAPRTNVFAPAAAIPVERVVIALTTTTLSEYDLPIPWPGMTLERYAGAVVRSAPKADGGRGSTPNDRDPSEASKRGRPTTSVFGPDAADRERRRGSSLRRNKCARWVRQVARGDALPPLFEAYIRVGTYGTADVPRLARHEGVGAGRGKN